MGTLFAAFLGYNPIAHLLGPSGVLHTLPGRHADADRQEFFPDLISGRSTTAWSSCSASAPCCRCAAVASLLRGGRYVHAEEGEMDFLDPQVPAPARDR